MDKRLPEYISLIQKCSRVASNSRKQILLSPNKVLPFPYPWGCRILIISNYPQSEGAGTAGMGEGGVHVILQWRQMQSEQVGEMQFCHPQLLQLLDTSLKDIAKTQLGSPVKNVLIAKDIVCKELNMLLFQWQGLGLKERICSPFCHSNNL